MEKALAHEVHVVLREFDVDFYLLEYPDVAASGRDPVEHFCSVGWREGRNPNSSFDVLHYLSVHRDIVDADLNPFYHFLFHGRAEGRETATAVRPSVRTKLIFGYSVIDWVDRLRATVDIDFYRSQLEVALPNDVDLVAHYAYRGWRLGKDPSATASTSEIAKQFAESARVLVNPLVARSEFASRLPAPGPSTTDGRAEVDAPDEAKDARKTPEERVDDTAPASVKLESLSEIDRYALVKAHFDAAYYLDTYQDVRAAKIDPLEHYYFTGWREQRNPNSQFDAKYYCDANDLQNRDTDNPFLHYLTVGRSQGLKCSPAHAKDRKTQSKVTGITSVIDPEFSREFYLSSYPDVAAAGVDPLSHYVNTGWRENRNPNAKFDTEYYLSRNKDVVDAGINPFWHYIVAGRAEGRLPKRPGGYRGALVQKAHLAASAPEFYTQSDEPSLAEKLLASRLKSALKSTERHRGVVVSLSHDCYAKVVGGTQIFISDEQQLFNSAGFDYVHLSPRRGQLRLAAEGDNEDFLLVVNGELVGPVSLVTFSNVYRRTFRRGKNRHFFVIHSFLGFSEKQLVQFGSLVNPERAFYWTHDYSSICEGYNLLRNDIDYCSAPAENSMACRVCRYGETRARHLAALRRVFSTISFEVLAPSARALEIWTSGVSLDYKSAKAHPHWTLLPTVRDKKFAKAAPKRKATLASRAPTLNVAFIGYASANKGWHGFCDIAEKLKGNEQIKLFHFATQGAQTLSDFVFVRNEVAPAARDATIKNLIAHEIDIVLMLAPWPETFSFVCHEALAAGSDVFCLADSGNVAAMAERGFKVHVFANIQAVADAVSKRATEKRTQASRLAARAFNICASGGTATVALENEAKNLSERAQWDR